jgi:ataxia telangiectasia mutated family protein
VAGSSNRIHQKLKSLDPAVRLSALQLLPFLVKEKEPSLEDVAEAMADLSKSVTAKQATVASWAMIACSR